jgi:hypothetical protein
VTALAASPAAEQLVALIGAAAADAVARAEAPRLPLCLTYAQAGEALGISERQVRALVDRGVLDRPAWSRTEVLAAVVTTASVASVAGWPVVPLEVAVPAA